MKGRNAVIGITIIFLYLFSVIMLHAQYVKKKDLDISKTYLLIDLIGDDPINDAELALLYTKYNKLLPVCDYKSDQVYNALLNYVRKNPMGEFAVRAIRAYAVRWETQPWTGGRYRERYKKAIKEMYKKASKMQDVNEKALWYMVVSEIYARRYMKYQYMKRKLVINRALKECKGSKYYHILEYLRIRDEISPNMAFTIPEVREEYLLKEQVKACEKYLKKYEKEGFDFRREVWYYITKLLKWSWQKSRWIKQTNNKYYDKLYNTGHEYWIHIIGGDNRLKIK